MFSVSNDRVYSFLFHTNYLSKQCKCITLLALSFIAMGCNSGGSGSSNTNNSSTTSPVTTVTAEAQGGQDRGSNQDFWEDVKLKLDSSSIENLVLIVGTSNGEVFSYQKGSLESDASVPIASASKWLTSATILALVEQGILTLTDHPQQYLDYWSNDELDMRSQVTLEHLLSFTSGFHRKASELGCIGDEDFTLNDCAEEIFAEGIQAQPGATLFYGPAHMQIAAAMAESASGTPWSELVHLTLVGSLNLSDATGFSGQNPRASGDAMSSAADYSVFLKKLMSGNFIGSNLSTLIAPRTLQAEIVSRPSATANFRDWHYGLGVWRECDRFNWDSSCEENVRISSPGRYGWYPWIDFNHGYYAILAMNETPTLSFSPAKESIALGKQIHSDIVEALSAAGN